jgi:hypothetical protein
MATGGETPRRASVFEIVGAWLRVWTPPRDVDIPPVPWRKVGVGTALGAVVIAGALALIVPRIEDAKRRDAARERARVAAAQAAHRAQVLHDQRPRHARAAGLRPAAGAPAAARERARAALVARVEASILADARGRARHGELRPLTGPTTCRPAPGTSTRGRFGVLDCFTVARRIPATEGNVPGAIGYPFQAVVDFRRFSYTWCKADQIPGEQLIPDPRLVVRLPAACRAPGSR